MSHHYDYRARAQLGELRAKFEDHARAEAKNRRRRVKRVNAIEDDVAFLALMNRALLEVVFRAGLCSQEEFGALLEAVDAADGVQDFGLSVSTLREEFDAEPEVVDKVQRFRDTFVKSMEKRRGLDPR